MVRGRKKLPVSRRLCKNLQVRFTIDEYDKIDRQADRRGRSMSELVRAIAFGQEAPINPLQATEEDLDVLG